MGAFYLVHRELDVDRDNVLASFTDRGFGSPKVFDLGQADLYLYKKQLVDDDNWVVDERGNSVFACGTVIYKGLDFRDSLAAILQDYMDKRLDESSLLGSFCLILKSEDNLEMILDASALYPVFHDISQQVLTSSFSACLRSSKSPRTINRDALLEKVLSGAIADNATLFNEIRVISLEAGGLTTGWISARFAQVPEVPDHFASRAEALDVISERLRYLSRSMTSVAQRYVMDLGLSGGYDSRLLFAMATDVPAELHLHSHFTNSTHLVNVEAAKEIAATKSLTVDVIKTTTPEQQSPDQLVETLENVTRYFDGCNNRNMGYYTETFTDTYRKRVLESAKFGLNGMNGEILRNHYFLLKNQVNFIDWMLYEHAIPRAWRAFRSKDAKKRYLTLMFKKFERQLGPMKNGTADFSQIRGYVIHHRTRHYAIWKNKAEQQLAYFWMPFMDAGLLEMSKRLTKAHLGLSGDFETELIRRYDPALVSIPSHYGFPLDQEPAAFRVQSRLKSMLPRRLFLLNRDVKVRLNADMYAHRDRIFAKGLVFEEAIAVIEELLPDLDGDIIYWYHQSLATSISIGHFLNVNKSYWTA